MRPIDSEVLLKEVEREIRDLFDSCEIAIMGEDAERLKCLKEEKERIKNAPALKYSPLISAHWIFVPFAKDGNSGYICSKCGVRNNNLPTVDGENPMRFLGSKFCPNCGAKMDDPPTNWRDSLKDSFLKGAKL